MDSSCNGTVLARRYEVRSIAARLIPPLLPGGRPGRRRGVSAAVTGPPRDVGFLSAFVSAFIFDHKRTSCPIRYQLLQRPTMAASGSLVGQRRVVHGVAVAKLEEVIVQEAVVELDFPPGLVQILKVKRIHAMLL